MSRTTIHAACVDYNRLFSLVLVLRRNAGDGLPTFPIHVHSRGDHMYDCFHDVLRRSLLYFYDVLLRSIPSIGVTGFALLTRFALLYSGGALKPSSVCI
jgi:hypothetical protein